MDVSAGRNEIPRGRMASPSRATTVKLRPSFLENAFIALSFAIELNGRKKRMDLFLPSTRIIPATSAMTPVMKGPAMPEREMVSVKSSPRPKYKDLKPTVASEKNTRHSKPTKMRIRPTERLTKGPSAKRWRDIEPP
jgi:hypothetical protein